MRSNVQLACVLLLSAAGCEKDDPLFCKENPGATGCPRPDGDVTADSVEIDGPSADAQQCFGTNGYSICLMAVPTGDVPLTGDFTTDDTNTACLPTQPASWSGAGQAEACIVVGATISVSTLNVTGNRPLVLVASDTITITGLLDVSSRRLPASKTGPDSDPTDCPNFTKAPTDSNNGAGGGAGGTFGTAGGDGGRGGNAAGNEGTAIAAGTLPPARLRGGCDGQDGADGEGNGGSKGEGGGAIYLAAGAKIVFANNAILNASGGSATKSDESAGGGGGGSGGMIVLNAPMIMPGTGVILVANGGGGSSGSDNSNGCGGCQPGADPNPLAPTTAAAGGTGGGGTGGAGAAGVLSAGPGIGSTTSGVGGGGGGGGAGFIQVSTAITGVTASPTEIVVP